MFAMILLFTPDTAAAQNTAASAVLLDRLISLVSILLFGGILFLFTMVLGKGFNKRLHTSRQPDPPTRTEVASGA